VDGVVEQGDGVAEQAAADLRRDQSQCGDHGPAEDRRAQRWVRVTVVVMAVTMTVAVSVLPGSRGCALTWRAVTGVIVTVSMDRRYLLFYPPGVVQATSAYLLSGHLDTLALRFH